MARAFERPATIALPEEVGPGLALDGLYVPVEGAKQGAVIAAPHPLMGGSMESPVVTELAWACERTGRASLRFNWRGIGASGGTPTDDLEAADVDYASATRFLVESVPGPFLACGYSFGALAALRATQRTPLPAQLVLVAPPTSMLSDELLSGFDGQILVVVGEDDPWSNAAELTARAEANAFLTVKVIAECDHFFMSGLAELSQIATTWLEPEDAEA